MLSFENTDEAAAASLLDVRPRVFGGDYLDINEVYDFLRWRPATFIAIVGDRDSGKTTFISALYNRFLKGAFADHYFAGSRTLLAFERISHYSRAESGSTKPDTHRTSITEGLRYFHLSIQNKETEASRELLIADRAGETYRDAQDNPAIVTDFPEIAQAEVILLLLDGKRVAAPSSRHVALQSARQSLRALLDGGALNDNSRVQIVLTKEDIVTAAPDVHAINDAIDVFYEALRKTFAGRLQQLSLRRVAARDPLGKLAPAHGIDKLLIEWLETRPRLNKVPLRIPELRSEFDKLLLRVEVGT